jgi:signal-transduction protein with cAMP-binding, CBS, and nucleotidyltransferase domain
MSSYKSAKDIASDQFYFIDGFATVEEAIKMMKEHEVDHLFIKKRTESDANGILVVSDIIKGVYAADLKPSEVSVYQLMTKPVISIPANLNARYISRLLLQVGLTVAPVEEYGEYIGVVHMRDLIFTLGD